MRDLIIQKIYDSAKWQSCLENGMEQELPRVDIMGNEQLLLMFVHFVLK